MRQQWLVSALAVLALALFLVTAQSADDEDRARYGVKENGKKTKSNDGGNNAKHGYEFGPGRGDSKKNTAVETYSFERVTPTMAPTKSMTNGGRPASPWEKSNKEQNKGFTFTNDKFGRVTPTIHAVNPASKQDRAEIDEPTKADKVAIAPTRLPPAPVPSAESKKPNSPDRDESNNAPGPSITMTPKRTQLPSKKPSDQSLPPINAPTRNEPLPITPKPLPTPASITARPPSTPPLPVESPKPESRLPPQSSQGAQSDSQKPNAESIVAHSTTSQPVTLMPVSDQHTTSPTSSAPPLRPTAMENASTPARTEAPMSPSTNPWSMEPASVRPPHDNNRFVFPSPLPSSPSPSAVMSPQSSIPNPTPSPQKNSTNNPFETPLASATTPATNRPSVDSMSTEKSSSSQSISTPPDQGKSNPSLPSFETPSPSASTRSPQSNSSDGPGRVIPPPSLTPGNEPLLTPTSSPHSRVQSSPPPSAVSNTSPPPDSAPSIAPLPSSTETAPQVEEKAIIPGSNAPATSLTTRPETARPASTEPQTTFTPSQTPSTASQMTQPAALAPLKDTSPLSDVRNLRSSDSDSTTSSKPLISADLGFSLGF